MRINLIKFSYTCLVMTCLTFSCNHALQRNEPQAEKKTINKQELSDDGLLDRVQEETFHYFWDGAEPNSGAACERIHTDNIYPQNDQHIVTSGGTGFGIMAIITGIERGFITRQEGYDHLVKLTAWLEKADRFHGAWPHWMNGETGKTKPFSKYDDGGDLVETAFLIQGLITARQYFKDGNEDERILANTMDELWKEVEWNWYTKGEEVLYWHWSPNHTWKMNFDVRGYNECLIMYVLAASSPTHAINPSVYHKGWARNGKISSDFKYYGLHTVLDHYETNDSPVGPLFWAHYSYLGLDPRELQDQYGDYWKLNQNHALIHYRHSVENPNDFKGYSDKCWGLTSSYSMKGYAGHRPDKDIGVISPTAALSSFPYTPEESMRFLRYLYTEADTLVGKYGPYDAFSLEHGWYLPRYLAIDQGPISVMIENYRSGLLWELFMSAEEIQNGLDRLGFSYKKHSIK